jgi:hypothetical protein
MGVLQIIAGMCRRADLMDAMMDRLGVADGLRQLPDHGGTLRRAAHRCLACAWPVACQKWVDHQTAPDSAPAFCRNRELFERVMAGVESDPGSIAS